MQFESISLQNFRVFVDEHLEFSRDPDRNVTVIHGQNGSGKTTLLNALRWALYGTVEFDQRPDRLANQGQMDSIEPGDTLDVKVSLAFEHAGKEHELTRTATFQKQNPTDLAGQEIDASVSLKQETETGRMAAVNNPDTQIEQMLPNRLSNLFLFDGEYINRLSGIDEGSEIKEAIQNIMGLEILERAIGHLEKVEGRFEDEIKEHGSDELQEYVEEKQQVREEIKDLESKVEDKTNSRKSLHQEIEGIDRKLERIAEVAELQAEREQKEERRMTLQQREEDITEEIQKEISKQGYLPFAMGAIEETAKEIDELREQGKIPSELDNAFVDDLLQEEVCICGRPLPSNSEPAQRVAKYKDDIDDAVDTAAVQLITRIGSLKDSHQDFFETIESKVKERSEVNDDIEALDQRIDELSNQIGDVEGYDPETDESPKELEERRRQKIKKRAQLKEQIENHEQRINELEEEIEKLNDQIDDAREDVREAALARKRMNAAKLVREEIGESFATLQQRVRSWSNERVKETFEKVARKSNYNAHITEDFELKIQEGIGGNEVEVGKSRGERQISSLAFIGSLVSIARERYEDESDNKYFSGGIYPIVMDSPFGSLDKDHREEISRIIPALAQQVVVMVTDGQWEGPVEEEMGSLAGKEYHLQYDQGGADSHPKTEIVPAKGRTIGEASS